MSLERVRAPFAFVPIDDDPVFIDEDLIGDGGRSAEGRSTWRAGAVAPADFGGYQDDPFTDGICGSFELEVEALTPVFVRGASADRSGAERFATTPEGKPAIPGSSLRGMLRNVVEIAARAKMNRVADRHFGIRDLYNRPLYLDHMAAIRRDGRGQNVPMPLVSAGWLQLRRDDDGDASPRAIDLSGDPDEVVATLTPCHFAKVSYEQMLASGVYPKDGRLGDKMSAPQKYAALQRANGAGDLEQALKVHVGVTMIDKHDAPIRGRTNRLGHYGKVRTIRPAGTSRHEGEVPGTLVMTGQPSRWEAGRSGRAGAGQPKHHDFVFCGNVDRMEPLPVTRAVFRAFSEVHSDSGERHGTALAPNDEWAWWQARFNKGAPVPVFFLRDDDGRSLRAFGLAMMFRLAYRHGVGDILEASQPAVYATRVDIAEAVFGRVALDTEARRDKARAKSERDSRVEGGATQPFDRRRAFAGRLRVGHAEAEGEARALGAVQVVLGQPKASYYPIYIAQKTDGRGRVQGAYKTLHDRDAQLAGWKRYRPQDAQTKPPLPSRSNFANVGTTFRPLAAGTRFVSTVHVHNLRPFELGALLWALDFGASDTCVHTMGLARSYGYGQVRLRVRDARLARNDAYPASPLDPWPVNPELLETARRAFVAFMQEKRPGWAESDVIRELRACATPLPSGSEDGRHMKLSGGAGRRGNEFVEAKKERLALPLASGMTRRTHCSAGVGAAASQRPTPSHTEAQTPASGAGAASEATATAPAAPPAKHRPTAAEFLAKISPLRKNTASHALHTNFWLYSQLTPEDQTQVADHIVAEVRGWKSVRKWRKHAWWNAIWQARSKD